MYYHAKFGRWGLGGDMNVKNLTTLGLLLLAQNLILSEVYVL